MSDTTIPAPPAHGYSIELLDATAAASLVDDITRIYESAFSAAPSWDTSEEGIRDFAQEIFPRHLRREGFSLAAARDSSGVLVGFCYGYIGEHGQYWTDYVAARIHPSLEKAWLGGHFEIAELAVETRARGVGVGHSLLTTLLDSRGDDRMSLQTLKKGSDAISLYEQVGFAAFGEFEDYVILGLRRS